MQKYLLSLSFNHNDGVSGQWSLNARVAGQLAAIIAYKWTSQGAVLCICPKKQKEKRKDLILQVVQTVLGK